MTKKEVTYTPEQMRAHAIALYAQCDDPAAHNHVIARIIRQGADAVAENAKLRKALKDIINCEDGDWDFCVKMIAEPALMETKP